MKSLMQRIEKVNPDRLDGYIKAFDRMLLYSLACSLIPPEALDETIQSWQKAIKKSIDIDVQNRTLFLESTPDGRKAKMVGEPDGEDIRLKFLETMDVAKDIIRTNLIKPDTLDNSDGIEESNC